MEAAIKIRSEFFDADLQAHGEKIALNIAQDAPKHKSDKKWIVRNTEGLKKQIENMRGDKLNFESRTQILIDKTLKTIPVTERKNYQEHMESLIEFLK